MAASVFCAAAFSPSPYDTAFSEGSGSQSVFAGSSPITVTLPSSKAHQKSGSFPPLALPSLGSTTTLSDTHEDHRHDDVGGATSVPHGPPPITRLTLPTCRAHYPDGPKRVRLSVASPLHSGLPRYSGGSASITSLSRPAQASLALRPVELLNRPRAAFVTRLQPRWLPIQAAR